MALATDPQTDDDVIDKRKHPPGSSVEVRTLADGKVLVVVKKMPVASTGIDRTDTART